MGLVSHGKHLLVNQCCGQDFLRTSLDTETMVLAVASKLTHHKKFIPLLWGRVKHPAFEICYMKSDRFGSDQMVMIDKIKMSGTYEIILPES